MNRLPAPFLSAASPAPVAGDAPSLLARSVREPSLLRLAQAIEELNPDLARALCRSGLASIGDPVERESWRARLAPFLAGEDDDDDGGPVLAAA